MSSLGKTIPNNENVRVKKKLRYNVAMGMYVR